MTADMLSWTRQQIEARKALAEAAPHAEPWIADTEQEGAGVWEADLSRPGRCSEHQHGKVNLCDDRLLLEADDFYADHKATLAHIAFNDPQQVIADCEADLTLLELHSHHVWDVCRGCGLKAPCWTARTLAARYRHRPGYQPSWPPEGTKP